MPADAQNLVLRAVLDPGHGGSERGAQYGGIDEADPNLAVCLHTLRVLADNRRIDVRLTRGADITLPLDDRDELVAPWDPHIVISVHHNANPSPRIKGLEAYHWPGNKTTEEICRTAVDAAPAPLSPGRVFDVYTDGGKRSWKQRPRRVVGEYSADCVLFEFGYLTNDADRVWAVSAAGIEAAAQTCRVALELAAMLHGV
jgi:N-acetylmuramoyl-L-alanine amidase